MSIMKSFLLVCLKHLLSLSLLLFFFFLNISHLCTIFSFLVVSSVQQYLLPILAT